MGVPYWPEIPWVSEPSEDKEIYEELVSGKGDPRLQKSFDNQEGSLGKCIKEGEDVWKDYSYSYDELIKLYSKF